MTRLDDLDSLVENMAAATRSGGTLPKMPAGLTLDEAYEIQKALVAAIAGDAVAGRKAGMTALASRKQFGIDHPLLGTLFAAGRMAPGISFPSAPGVMLECEIGVVIGRDGTPKTAGPVIEVPRMAFADGEELTGINLVACSISADRYIAGTQSPLLESLRRHSGHPDPQRRVIEQRTGHRSTRRARCRAGVDAPRMPRARLSHRREHALHHRCLRRHSPGASRQLQGRLRRPRKHRVYRHLKTPGPIRTRTGHPGNRRLTRSSRPRPASPSPSQGVRDTSAMRADRC